MPSQTNFKETPMSGQSTTHLKKITMPWKPGQGRETRYYNESGNLVRRDFRSIFGRQLSSTYQYPMILDKNGTITPATVRTPAQSATIDTRGGNWFIKNWNSFTNWLRSR